MRILVDTPDRLVVEHSAGKTQRSTVWVMLFVSAVFIFGPILMTVADLTAPATRVVECDRAAAQCRINPRWGWQGWHTFVMAQLDDFAAYQTSENGYVLASTTNGGVNYFSNEVDAPADVAALQRAVADMHAFKNGSAPTLHVEWPKGHFKPAPLGRALFFLLGLANLFWTRRALWRVVLTADKSEIAVDKKAHPLWPSSRFTIPASSVKAIATANVNTPPTRPSFNLAMVALRNAEGREILLEREYLTPYSVKSGRDLADKLGKFLGVPVENVKA